MKKTGMMVDPGAGEKEREETTGEHSATQMIMHIYIHTQTYIHIYRERDRGGGE